ncbi:MAG: sigma-70 family RNA polymerase sigma factor [Glaciecola sp.]|jgi:RNA polymerase sigma-70 factor (ECF subfamily)
MDAEQQRKLSAFFEGIQQRALLFCKYRKCSDDDALDVIQDAMMAFLPQYTSHDTKTWEPLFFTILRHKLIDKQRWQTLQNKVFFWRQEEADECAWLDQQASEQMFRQTSTHIADTEGLVAQQQIHVAVARAIQGLPEMQQTVFILKVMNGFSEQTIATILFISTGSVKQHFARAKQKLQAQLEHTFVTEVSP